MIIVRLATIGDSKRIFEWRNDPVTIATSRTQAGVEWDGHSKWFPAQLSHPNTVCLLAEYDEEPFGVVWFRKGPAEVWETSINIAPPFRRRKLSTPMLAAAMTWMRDQHGDIRFAAEVMTSNTASIKTFENCGFIFIYPSPGFGTYCTF